MLCIALYKSVPWDDPGAVSMLVSVYTDYKHTAECIMPNTMTTDITYNIRNKKILLGFSEMFSDNM